MLLPDQILVRIQGETREDLSGLIVKLTLPVGSKNPYHIFFPKTDESGVSVITAIAFRGQFEDHWEEGLMDYDGTMESASGYVRLTLFDPAQMRANLKTCLAWPLLKNEKNTWASRKQMVEYFLSCRNDGFELARTPHLIKFQENGKLVLKVRSRGT